MRSQADSHDTTTIPLGAGTKTAGAHARKAAAAIDAASAASARVAASAPATILDLGKHLAAIDVARNFHDCAELETEGDSPRSIHALVMDILYDRGQAIRSLIATMPARTIADAAVQIAASVNIASTLSGHDLEKPEVEECAGQLLRMLSGALPIVAAAAGLDMAAMDWADDDQLRATRFAGVGVVR